MRTGKHRKTETTQIAGGPRQESYKDMFLNYEILFRAAQNQLFAGKFPFTSGKENVANFILSHK